MKHRLFTFLLAVMASIGTMFAETYSGSCGENLTWSLNTEDSVLTISGTGLMESFNNTSDNPWYVHRTAIKSAIIGSGVTSIGSSAFYGCSSLTSVTIPNSVTFIEVDAFSKCSGLTSVTIPNNVTSIENGAFEWCSSLTSMNIPDGVTKIGRDAFRYCNGLTSVSIPVSITQIAAYAFEGCNGLTRVNITDLTAWCNITFNGSGSNPLSNAKHLYLNDTEITNLVIPESITDIGSNTFCNCSGITSVTIPNSVTRIGEGAFSNCTGLTSLVIPNSITRIDGGAFSGCSGLTSIEIPNSVTTIGSYAFSNCYGLTSVTIPNSITRITKGAFFYCSNLISVTIPSSVTRIDESAFSRCYGLTKVNITDLAAWCNITFSALEANPLNDARHLYLNDVEITDLVIPESVTSISNYVFYRCESLTSLTIPNSVTSIGGSAFHWCTGITSITCKAVIPPTSSPSAFQWIDKFTPLYVPAESIALYQAADVWKDFGNILPIEDTPEPCITASGACGAEGDNLAWTLSCDSVLTISGTGAMADYSYSSSEQIPQTPWNSYLSKIKSVVIENGVTSIGEWAFYECTGLTSVTIPNSVTSIGNYAFNGCSGLTSIEIPNSVTSIGDAAFYNCSGLTSVTIPNSVTSIGRMAFYTCSSLTSIDVAIDNTNYSSIDGVLFNKDQTSLIQYPGAKQGAYTIPNSVTSIGGCAFYGCSGLTSVTIPNSVTSIGMYTFYGCSGLTSITNHAIEPQTIDVNVFNKVNKSSCTLYVPAESVEAYQAADVWKDFYNILPIEGTEESNYATLADIYNMAADSVFTLGAFDVVYVASYQNGANMYIKDASGSGVIYMPSYGLQAGDHVEAGLQGKVHIYNGLYEITPISTKEELTITSGEAPAPMEATEAPSLANVNQYLVYKNVSFSTDTAFVEGRRHMVYGTWNGQEIAFYNQYHIGATLSTDKTYNITAVNSVYGTALQVYPLAVEEVDSVPDLCVIASGTCGAEGDNLTWTLTCDSVLTISGTGAMADYEESTNKAPWASLRYAIRSTIIENGVTNIGNFAFYPGSGLTSVTIPNSVTQIGLGAFYGCNLTSLAIPNSVITIKGSAFRYCRALTSVSIPSSVQTIGSDAFEYCDNLETVYIPSSVISIGNSAFAGNKKMRSINVDEANPNYSSIDGVLFNKNQTVLVQYPLGKEGAQYTIPNTVTTLKSMSFSYFSKTLSYNGELTSIVIPNSVTMIYGSAFWASTAITSITNYAMVPQVITANDLDKSTCTLYVPAQSIEAYQAADVWKEFGTILPIEGTDEPVETIEGNYTIYYMDKDSQDLTDETVTLHVPVAPVIDGFTFVEWRVVEGSLSLGITIQAVYEENEPTSAPAVYTNPANPAQKLIRNGNVYILTDDKIYSITGQEVR